MVEQLSSDLPLTTKGKAYGVRVKHEAGHHAKGSGLSTMARCLGRGISPGHAPRHARNAGDHSSIGSRMTLRPLRRTRTSRWRSANRHSLGRRTAWLPPFWKSLARAFFISEVYTAVYTRSSADPGPRL